MHETIENRYPGVNAHLNSFLQQRGGGWESFHARYISEMQVLLDQVLPPNYYAISEKSLQITQYGVEEHRTSSIYPDVSIFRHAAQPSVPSHAEEGTAPTLTLPIRQVMAIEEEETVNSVVIYEYASGQIPGKPVVRIELLSPANKPQGSDYSGYMKRRSDALRSAVTLVEIDFLHKQRPLLPGLASYPDRAPGAVPYLVLVTDPHPDVANGLISLFEVPVDAPLPKVRIPLVGEESVILDCISAYNHVIETTRVFRLVVDYSTDPVDFDTFSEDDQQKIQAILKRVREQS